MIFGIKTSDTIFQNVLYVDSDHIIYIAGNYVVLMELKSKQQTMLQGLDGCTGFTAIAVSNNRAMIATAEKNPVRGIVSLLDVKTFPKRKRNFSVHDPSLNTSSDNDSKEYVCISFSKDDKLVLLLGGLPLNNLVIWQWDKNKLIASLSLGKNLTIYQCSFNPNDSNIVVVVGKGTFKFYKLTENQLKHIGQQIKNKEENISTDYTVHAWIEGGSKIVLCNAQGDIQIYDSNGEFKCTVLSSPSRQLLISCVIPFSKGFIISESSTMISVYFKADKGNKDQKNPYKLHGSFKLSSGYALVWMSKDPSNDKSIDESALEDKIVFSLSSGQLLTKTIAYENLNDSQKNIENVICEFHTSKITGLDSCLMRPFVVTSSIDKTIKIWNYATNKLELSFPFVEEVQSVAIHPSGYHLIAAFNTTVRLMNIFSEKLKQYKELPYKKCCEVKFSNGGHLFALVDSDSVIIFDFYNLVIVNKISGLGSVISCVNWFEDDSAIIFCSINGRVATCPYNGEKNIVDGDASNNYICTIKSVGKKEMFACGQFEFIKKYTPEESKKKSENDEKEHKEEKTKVGLLRAVSMATKSNISQIITCSTINLFIAGTADSNRPGTLRAYKYPLSGAFKVTQAHSTQVSKIKVSYNDKVVFSAGNDGTLILFKIVLEGEENKTEDSLIFPFKEILTNKQELEDKQKEILQLQISKDEIKAQNARQRDILEAAKKKELDDLKKRKEDAVLSGETDIGELTQKKKEIEQNSKETLEKMEQEHKDKKEKEKRDHEQKMDEECKELKKLKSAIELKKEEFDKEKVRKYEEYQSRYKEAEEAHEFYMQEFKKKQDELDAQHSESELKSTQKRTELETKKDKELEKKIIFNIQETQVINNEGLKKKEELMEYKKTETEDSKAISTKNQEIRKKDQELKTIDEQNTTLKKAIANLEAEIEERKATLEEKKKRVNELNRKKQELNKFSFVLDYKIKELRRDINPKEQEIQKLKEQAANMDQELKQFKRVNNNLCLIVEDMQLRQKGMKREIKIQKEKLEQLNIYIAKFHEDINECGNKTGNYRSLKEAIINLHKKFVKEEVKVSAIDTDAQKEYSIHRKHLENKVQSLNSAISKDQDDHKKENIKLMKENVVLIEQINDLRKTLIFRAKKKKQEQDFPKDPKEKEKLLKMDEERIKELNDKINNLTSQIEYAKKHAKLPPVSSNKQNDDEKELPKESKESQESKSDSSSSNNDDENEEHNDIEENAPKQAEEKKDQEEASKEEVLQKEAFEAHSPPKETKAEEPAK